MRSLKNLTADKNAYNKLLCQGNYKEAMEGYKSIFNDIISLRKTEHACRDLAITCVSNYVIAMKKSEEPDEIDDLDFILVDLIKFFQSVLRR